ncbi:hypothetical protein [Eisenibacter elegans]|jgi:hypothetical protein|uniref:hypothetical protein n=1 Tax=Eisenibacter elegans TaxID=997 RepID=UPI00041AE8D9|nr:hypothetical protein [Eisenibacter elegans]
MKPLYTITLLLALISTVLKASPLPPDTVPTPKGYLKLVEALGDLNGDSSVELVVIYQTNEETDLGMVREIRIFQKTKGNWSLWHQSRGAVLPSQAGGMMGDPFQTLSIKNGQIVLEHFGGSREKWQYIHTYQYQDKQWYLAKAEVEFGDPCGQTTRFEYQLKDGAFRLEQFSENCDEVAETVEQRQSLSFGIPPQKKYPMDDFNPGENPLELGPNNIVYF